MNRQRSGSPLVPSIAIGIAVLVLLFSLAAPGWLWQSPVGRLLRPVEALATTAVRLIEGALRPLSTGAGSQQDVLMLQQQLAALSAENVRLREYQAELQQMRLLNNFAASNPALSFVGADIIGLGNQDCQNVPPVGSDIGLCAAVIAGDPSPYARFITINAGRNAGLVPGMPVIGGGGVLIGRVGRNIGPSSAQVQLINDSASFINVQLVGSRATGTVAGQSDGTLRLQNVLQTEVVQPGDFIVTSGLGGGLPPGLAVGQVDTVISKDLETLKEATVRPGAELSRLEVVFVLRFIPPT
jgi:cell shape-determining protein MreC